MNISIGKRIAAGFALALVALLSIGVFSYRNLDELNTDAFWVTHTVEVLQKLESIVANLEEAESSARGYQIAGLPAFRDTFKTDADAVTDLLKTVRNLTIDNPNQGRRSDRLDPIVFSRLDTLRRLMELHQATRETSGSRLVSIVQEGSQQMGDIRKILDEMEGEEKSLLKARQTRAAETARFTLEMIAYGTLLTLLLVGGAGFFITRSIISPLGVLREGATKIGGGDYRHRVAVQSRDEVGHLATVFNQMATQIDQRQQAQADQDWLKTSLAKFSLIFQGQRNLQFVCQAVLDELASLLNARHSVLYTGDPTTSEKGMKLWASYACENPQPWLKSGEGLVGQCFLEKKRVILSDIPGDYIKISSALGRGKPAAIVVLPALYEGEVKAVLELASFQPFTEIELIFLNQLADSLGIVLNTIDAGMRTEQLLEETRTQADRLQKSEKLLQEQQEELQQANEEMEQTNEELRQTNEEMEEKASLLAEQKKEMERANREIEQSRVALEEKAAQLAQTSKYKSEFLASMSHELRTPLNSLLLLSGMLADNLEKNLSEKQVQYAETIQSSGKDLLELINDILDLSKIESGTVDVEVGELVFADLTRFVEDTFRHIAQGKKLDFKISSDSSLPPAIKTDVRRLQQIIKNLLSNAFKFTERGSVELDIKAVQSGWDRECRLLNDAESVIAFTVTDSGIGIPPEKQQLIFEAFQQAEAGTARKYGGTGLGLSICREISWLLGGSLRVESEAGRGSSFTLYIPSVLDSGKTSPARAKKTSVLDEKPVRQPLPGTNGKAKNGHSTSAPESAVNDVEDDLPDLSPDDRVLLIIEDDQRFARVLADFAREKKFKPVVTSTAARGMALAKQLSPAAITLDLGLPDCDGLVVLDRLKHDPKTQHIPIHLISGHEERARGLKLGAISYLQKPVTKDAIDNILNQTLEFINHPMKNLLLVEDDAIDRDRLMELIGDDETIRTTAVGSGRDALNTVGEQRFDCIVIDLGLPDMPGTDLIRSLQKRYKEECPPIIVYTGKELTRKEETELRLVSESIILKDVRSPERLLDETALFLHRVQSKLPESKRQMIEHARREDSVLSGRKVLVVDDDVRNIFALTALLEGYHMQVSYAESGKEALEILAQNPGVEVVLMDVMMPEMDGFEAIRRIRDMAQYKHLPIISVTAKAMKGDREKCIEAGASDYITKPVDMDQLLSLLRVWLYQ